MITTGLGVMNPPLVTSTLRVKQLNILGLRTKIMSEIKNKITERPSGSFLIEKKHTITDIARWIIEQDWQDEVVYFLENRNEL
jgi:hypothetical protein